MKSGDAIYAAVLPSTNPYDPTTPDGKMYAAMVLTLDQIANSIVKR